MSIDTVSIKMVSIGLVAGVVLVASLVVLGLVSEREARFRETQSAVADGWGDPQTLMGPVLVFTGTAAQNGATDQEVYVVPQNLHIESALEPEVRTRGIWRSVIYTEKVRVEGVFARGDLPAAPVTPHTEQSLSTPTLVVGVSDTRSIAEQVMLTLGDTELPLEPGVTVPGLMETGMHAPVSLPPDTGDIPFSFELTLKGTEEVRFVPVGALTEVTVRAPWPTPSFVGAFLPDTQHIVDGGFDAHWQVSSYGRGFPQTWEGAYTVAPETFQNSALGVRLEEGVDFYRQTERSVKYAVLLIAITFATFFLFEVLGFVRVHPIVYLLVGAALALFYVLLLALAEHIGFGLAYLAAAAMTVLLITGYTVRALGAHKRGYILGLILMVLYGYLYFVLNREDYALLFGALLLFALLTLVMYLTRKVDWYHFGSDSDRP